MKTGMKLTMTDERGKVVAQFKVKDIYDSGHLYQRLCEVAEYRSDWDLSNVTKGRVEAIEKIRKFAVEALEAFN